MMPNPSFQQFIDSNSLELTNHTIGQVSGVISEISGINETHINTPLFFNYYNKYSTRKIKIIKTMLTKYGSILMRRELPGEYFHRDTLVDERVLITVPLNSSLIVSVQDDGYPTFPVSLKSLCGGFRERELDRKLTSERN